MILFSINNKDFTHCIKAGTYQVQKNDVYNDWQDGFGMTHHDVYRKRIEGSFDMYFVDESEYLEFLRLIENKEAGGYLSVSLYLNNLDIVENEVKVFLTKKIKDEIPFLGTSKYSGFTIDVYQR